MSVANRRVSLVDKRRSPPRRSMEAAKKHKSMPAQDNPGDESDDTESNEDGTYTVEKILAIRNVIFTFNHLYSI